MAFRCLASVIFFLFFPALHAEELFPENLTHFVQEMRQLLEPDEVRFLGFSSGEREVLTQEARKQEEAVLFSSNGGEALVETGESEEKEVSFCMATPFNEEGYSHKEWKKEEKAYKQAYKAFFKAMRGRVMYVIPYSLGKPGVLEKPVLQITDSPLIALAALHMGRTGQDVLSLFEKGDYLKSLHCGGNRFPSEESFLFSFLKKNEVWSYGPHSTLDMIRREILFRLPSHIASEEGWIAAHMPLFALTNPEGNTRYGLFLLPAYSSPLSFLQMKLRPGWDFSFLSFDASWLFRQNGRIMAFNPEKGDSGTLSGPLSSSLQEKICAHALLSGISFTEERELWWEGKAAVRPWKLFDAKGSPWRKKRKPSLFMLPKTGRSEGEQYAVVPLSMVIVLADKKNLFPPIREAASWEEGIMMASLLSSENEGTRLGMKPCPSFDPFALRDSCGMNLGDYIGNWMELRDMLVPQHGCHFFAMNPSCRTGKKYEINACFPLFQWCFERCEGSVEARSTPFGLFPLAQEIDIHAIDQACSYDELFHIDKIRWRKELFDLKWFLKKWEDRVPVELVEQILVSASLDTLES